jgi:hypothetical protein
MLFLLGDISDRPWALLAPQGKDPVSSLPAEGAIARGLVIEMIGAAAFDLFDKIGDRHIRWNRNHHMDMVTHAIKGLDHTAQGIGLAPNVGEQNLLAIGCNQRVPILRRPDQMIIIALKNIHRLCFNQLPPPECPDHPPLNQSTNLL